MLKVINKIEPNFGHESGGTLITVFANNFLNVSNYQCRFGSENVNAIFLDSNRIQCLSPSYGSGPKTVSVIVLRNGIEYAPGAVTFTYLGLV